MPSKKPAKKTVHIDFTPEEYALLEKRAAEVGMPINAFARQLILTGKVKGYNMQPLIDHTLALGVFVSQVRKSIASPHPDRWEYEADITYIEALTQQVLAEERGLHEHMMRRLKR